jgi:hypothetical protein
MIKFLFLLMGILAANAAWAQYEMVPSRSIVKTQPLTILRPKWNPSKQNGNLNTSSGQGKFISMTPKSKSISLRKSVSIPLHKTRPVMATAPLHQSVPVSVAGPNKINYQSLYQDPKTSTASGSLP